MRRHGWKFIVVIILAVIVGLWLIKAPVLSAYITDKMGVQVTFNSISVWPKETTIHSFRIANPLGFKTRTAFEAVRTHIQYRWGSLFTNPAHIDQIVLDDVRLNIEIRNATGSDNNWAALGAKIRPRSSGRAVIIHKLIIRNLTVDVTGSGAKLLGVSGTRHFDQMEFNEINSAHGFPTKELIREIFGNTGMLKYIQNLLNPIKDIQDTLNPFKIFGEKETPEESSGVVAEKSYTERYH